MRLSRRDALFALAGSTCACPAGEPPPASVVRAVPNAAAPPATGAAAGSVPKVSGSSLGGLEVVTLGPLGPEDKGGKLVVLLHGWGARGDDLVPLAQRLARPGVRFLVPVGPLPEARGGRAWWHLDQRPAQAVSDEPPPGHQPHRDVSAARAAVQALLRDARQRYAPESVALVGFSQGAMLALDVAIAGDPEVDRVAVLSGALLVDSLSALRAPKARRAAVFVAHGLRDPMLPFRGAERIKAILEPHGHPVTWLPFDGAHEIPDAVVAALREFVFHAAP